MCVLGSLRKGDAFGFVTWCGRTEQLFALKTRPSAPKLNSKSFSLKPSSLVETRYTKNYLDLQCGQTMAQYPNIESSMSSIGSISLGLYCLYSLLWHIGPLFCATCHRTLRAGIPFEEHSNCGFTGPVIHTLLVKTASTSNKVSVPQGCRSVLCQTSRYRGHLRLKSRAITLSSS